MIDAFNFVPELDQDSILATAEMLENQPANGEADAHDYVQDNLLTFRFAGYLLDKKAKLWQGSSSRSTAITATLL